MASNKAAQRIEYEMKRRNFLQYAGSGALLGAAGLLSPRRAHSSPGLGKVDRRKLFEYPIVSDKEKERRWNAAWKFMQDHRVDALLVMQGGGVAATNFFSNYETSSIIFFPKQGAREPISFLPGLSGQQVDFLFRSEMHGQVSWIRDWRVTYGDGPGLVATIKERQLANARVGTIGLSAEEPWSVHPLEVYLKKSLPETTFVELYDEFVPLWMTHSQEELAMLRKAALGLEAAAEAFVEAVKPGANLYDIEVFTLSAGVPYGLSMDVVSLYTGPLGGRGNWWWGRGLPPPVVKKGHLVNAEISCSCGHMAARAQITVSVGEPSQEIATLGRLARESYEAGLKQIRPGNTFGAVCDAMAQVNQKGGAWNITPLISSLNPIEARSMAREAMLEKYPGMKERFGQGRSSGAATSRAGLVLQEGMTFALRPNALYTQQYVNIGGTVICTGNGSEELNEIANRLIVLDV